MSPYDPFAMQTLKLFANAFFVNFFINRVSFIEQHALTKSEYAMSRKKELPKNFSYMSKRY